MKRQLFLLLTGLAALPLWAQQPRAITLVDDANQAVDPRGLYTSIDGEGDVRVVSWPDDRGGGSDVFCSISTDRGLSWGTEIQITDARTTGLPALRPQLVYQNGVIHIICEEETGARDNDLAYWRSDDLGQTWTRQLLVSEMILPSFAVEGDDVIVIYGLKFTFYEVYSRWSSDQGLSFDAEVDVEPSSSALMSNWDVTIDGGKAHVVYNRVDDVWYAQSWGGAYHSHARIDQAPNGTGLPRDSQIEVDGGALHVVWMSIDRNGGAFGDHAIYYNRSANLGTSWQNDRLIGQYAAGQDTADSPRLDVDGNVMAIQWDDDRTGSKRNYVACSEDFGTTFKPDFEVPLTATGTSVLWGVVQVEHNTIAVLGLEHITGSTATKRVPVLCLSTDAGDQWSANIDLDPTLMDGSRDSTGRQCLHLQDGDIDAIWASFDGPNPRNVRASGLRLPVVEFRKTAATKAVLDMKFIDVRHQNDTARWVASTTLGTSVHPENPALQIQLGASGVLNQSLNKAAILSGTVNSAGEASSKQIPIKPGLIGKTIFFQGWINNGGLGETPSEVLVEVIS